MDHRKIKQESMEIIRQSKPSIISVSAVYIIITAIISFYVSSIMNTNITTSVVQKFRYYALNNEFENAVNLLSTMAPPRYAYLIQFICSLVTTILSGGFVIFLLNSIRHKEPCYGNLLDGFGFFWKLILLDIIRDLLIALGTILFVVPGIILAFRYSMAVYILCDDPSKSVIQCLKESARIMKGHKMELFKLEFSFIGWFILDSLPVIGYAIDILLVPYFGTVKALFYEQRISKPAYYEAEYSAI